MLICATVLAVAGCGGGADEGIATWSTPPAATASSSASGSAAPSSAAGGTSDKKVCESAKKAGEDMKAALVAAVQSGTEPSPALFKKVLTELDEEVTSLAARAGDGPVATALKRFGAEAAKAAAADDPATAADTPAFAKAGTDLAAACRTAGVDINF